MDTQTVTEVSSTHGHKRAADDNLDCEQRLNKRFNLLNLENIGKLYIPAAQQPPAPPRRSRSNAFSDTMNLDDTRYRVYIHNLDDEISDAESEGEKLVFLPDIEKRLTKIPKSVLTSQSQPHTSNEVVLYGVPESISIPREQDNVRKAFIESRERARQRHVQAAESASLQSSNLIEPGIMEKKGDVRDEGSFNEPVIAIYYEDAMDLG